MKPTGQDNPEASSRWIWDSVVRAPIAPHDTRSAMNCGEILIIYVKEGLIKKLFYVSKNSHPVGNPNSLISSNNERAIFNPIFIDICF